MNTILHEIWVTRTYLLADGNTFKFLMGRSEINMLNALVACLGSNVLADVTLEEKSEKLWIAKGKPGTQLEDSEFKVEMRHGCPELPVPPTKYSVMDGRLESHKHEPYKPMPQQLKFL